MTRIKICGIKEETHAAALIEAGVDFMGMVFAASPRQVTITQAKKIAAILKSGARKTELVGVFVNTPATIVNKAAETCKLDWIQLSGDEPWEFCLELGMPVIKVIRLGRNYKAEKVCSDLEYGSSILAQQKHMFLLDTNVRDKYGGTGKTFDWKLAKPIAERFPVIAAGGLTPENVAEAMASMKPWGVDVSSGVETGGTKDMEKIKRFIEAVREKDG